MNDHCTSYTGAVLERQDLDPAERRRFQTGRPCLDLTHTGGYGEYARWEILQDADDVARYLGLILGLEPPETTATDVMPTKDLRHALTRLARDHVAGRAQPQDAINTVNRFAAAPPVVPILGRGGTLTHGPATASQALSSLARDAIDLFGSPLVARIRICEGEMCELLFVDTSRPGQRRWCSMEWCGDHEKKRAAGRPGGRRTTAERPGDF
jgi:predicted RNA-binding Zn ribbon-like protein